MYSTELIGVSPIGAATEMSTCSWQACSDFESSQRRLEANHSYCRPYRSWTSIADSDGAALVHFAPPCAWRLLMTPPESALRAASGESLEWQAR